MVAAFVGCASCGSLLSVNNRQKSDLILVLDGDDTGSRYEMGLALLRAGFGSRLIVNARADSSVFGHTRAQLAEEFVDRTAGADRPRVQICRVTENATAAEAHHLSTCLGEQSPKSILLVTSQYHSRRALLTFRRFLPQYSWSVAYQPDPSQFGTAWWKHREWAKTTLVEWQKLWWWLAVDRWRNDW